MSIQSPVAPPDRRLPVLDGIRAVSILAVLVTHLLPVRVAGHAWNDSVGLFGMALFFVLSGFLITTQLISRPAPRMFIARRLCRIVPVAWLCIAIVVIAVPMDAASVLSQLFFYANLPPQRLMAPLDHFWSLCVEVQFYVVAAVLLWLRPAVTWWLLPAFLLAVTSLRMALGVSASSVTWFRADDLLAGACLALLMNSSAWSRATQWLRSSGLVWLLLVLLCLACILPKSGDNWLLYVRPYLAAAFVAALLACPDAWLSRLLCHRWLAYIAAISYALYVWHVPLAYTWLGSGEVLEKYLKRPLLLIVLFGVAHLSTFYFEKRFIDWGKRIGRPRATPVASA